jgi:hypothetical protein
LRVTFCARTRWKWPCECVEDGTQTLHTCFRSTPSSTAYAVMSKDIRKTEHWK